MINLKKIVEETAKAKNIDLNSGQIGRLRNWERDFQRGKLDAESVMKNVRGEFSYNFDRNDYAKIEREIS